MGRPASLVGKKRLEAVAQIAAGKSDREIARAFGVDHKTISKLRRDSAGSASAASRMGAKSPTGVCGEDIAETIEKGLRIRLELRDGLLEDFRTSSEPRERALVAKELGACLDGIAKVVSPVAVVSDEEEDVEAEAFDAYMMRIVAKARVVVAADGGVSSQEEPPGTVGAGARASGTN
jgi:hypothetical protein